METESHLAIKEAVRGLGAKQVAADCFPVRNPQPPAPEQPAALMKSTQVILREFSELLGDVSTSIEDDGAIDQKEALAIRQHWEKLKHLAESFIVACEAGHYDKKPK